MTNPDFLYPDYPEPLGEGPEAPAGRPAPVTDSLLDKLITEAAGHFPGDDMVIEPGQA